jgi:hypothetical protein
MDTTLISLRIPNTLLLSIDATAAALKRSRARVIVDALENGPAKPGPTVQKQEPEVSAKPVSPPVRAISEPTKVKSCPECGSMSGLHQRWCKRG